MEGLGAKCCSAPFCSSSLGKHRALSLPSSTLEYLLEKSFLLPTRPHLHLLIYRYLYSNPASVWTLPSILPIAAPAAPHSSLRHCYPITFISHYYRASDSYRAPTMFLSHRQLSSHLQFSSRTCSFSYHPHPTLHCYTLGLSIAITLVSNTILWPQIHSTATRGAHPRPAHTFPSPARPPLFPISMSSIPPLPVSLLPVSLPSASLLHVSHCLYPHFLSLYHLLSITCSLLPVALLPVSPTHPTT